MKAVTSTLSVVEGTANGYDAAAPSANGAAGDSWHPLSEEAILQLQMEQHQHDDRYHPEISRLSVHHRLNHLALHFAKYAGRIADACRADDDSDINRTLTDMFIIGLSAANVLNLHLGPQLSGASILRHQTGAEPSDLTDLLLVTTSASGRMAAACEAIDHLEARPLREEISAAVVALAQTALIYGAQRRLDMVGAVRSRLEQVRCSKIFHGQI